MTKGTSLYLALMILSLLLAISLGLSALLFGQFKIAKGMEESVIAFYAADTGIEKMLFDFKVSEAGSLPNNSFFTVSAKCAREFAACPPGYETDSLCEAPRYCVYSVGSYRETRRAIRVEY